MNDDDTPFDRLEALSREVEQLATEVAIRAKAFGGQAGAGPRVAQVKARLRTALDELAAYPASADEITDA
jgi:hypothetical protein